MTKPASSTLATDSGVELVLDLKLELESNRGVENEMLGGRPVEPEREPETYTLIKNSTMRRERCSVDMAVTCAIHKRFNLTAKQLLQR